ncbi:N-acetyltransferase [Flagellimonas aquimarina]|uniref:N-acetyltransferase n=1 Tax=Flagellimonas aquimarina TaxID=2201895 RepID=A0A316L5N8_9FLAO|nr:GNAT family protein [Allomuricauda koreensis]PWL39583.1 N-acetyltransferase [Allomuricauda koreensis]
MTLDFTKDYVLENDRVKLIPLTADHVDLLWEISREKNLWTYFLGKSDGSGDFKKYILEAIADRDKKSGYPFAVYDKMKKCYAGCTRFFDYQENLNIIRLGYTWYGKDFRGTGVNKNCKYLMFQFAFDQIGLERVGLGAHSENKVSIAAMKSVGCTKEGQIRNLFPSIHGKGRSDAVLLGILKQEWLENKKKNLKSRL